MKVVDEKTGKIVSLDKMVPGNVGYIFTCSNISLVNQKIERTDDGKGFRVIAGESADAWRFLKN